jgi:hypothetical protein
MMVRGLLPPRSNQHYRPLYLVCLRLADIQIVEAYLENLVQDNILHANDNRKLTTCDYLKLTTLN